MNVSWPFRRFTISMIVSELHMVLQYVHFDFFIDLPPHDLRKLPPEQKKVESSSLKNLEKKLMSCCFKKTQKHLEEEFRGHRRQRFIKSRTFRNCSVIWFHFHLPRSRVLLPRCVVKLTRFHAGSWFSKLLNLSFLSSSHTSPCVSLHGPIARLAKMTGTSD